MNHLSHEEPEDHFAFFAEWIAAHARLWLRAVDAGDATAIEVSLMHFRCFLVKALARHLRDEPRWPSGDRWLDGIGIAVPEITSPGRLKLRDELVWATRDNQFWYEEPFELELELCPTTGAFQRYTSGMGTAAPSPRRNCWRRRQATQW